MVEEDEDVVGATEEVVDWLVEEDEEEDEVLGVEDCEVVATDEVVATELEVNAIDVVVEWELEDTA